MNAHTGGSTHSTHGFAHPERNVALLGITPGMIVADFGAGSGAYVFECAKLVGDTGHVYAIDVQKELLRKIHNEAIRKNLSNVSIVWGDVEAVHGSKLAEVSVDIVIISNMLFQAEDKRAVFREAHRVLKDEGILVVIDWSDSFGGLGPRAADIVTKDAVMDIAARERFNLHEDFHAGAHHYGLMGKKVEVHSPRIRKI